MATAAVAVGGATGIRAWLAAKNFAWLTPKRLKRLTFAVISVAVIAAATLSGSGA